MKRIKLKNWNVALKKKIMCVIIFSIFFAFLLSFIFIKNLSSNLTTYIAHSVKKQNILLLKESFAHVNEVDIDIDKLIKVLKNSKDEISEVDFDIKKSSQLLSEITGYLNENLNDYNFLGYRLDIPIGLLSKNPILTNVGPKIPVKVEVSDVALGNVRTNVKSFGINNALIEVYLDIFIRTSILYPFEVFEIDSEYSSLIASKIIAGSVPSLFGGTVNSKSDMINIPISE